MCNSNKWIPNSLYKISVEAFISNFAVHSNAINSIPNNILFDAYHEIYKQGRLCFLSMEFCNIHIFSKLLRVPHKRFILHSIFQAIIDHGTKIYLILATSFNKSSAFLSDSQIYLGLDFYNFFNEIGYYNECEIILLKLIELLHKDHNIKSLLRKLECFIYLLDIQIKYSKFIEAEDTIVKLDRLVNHIKNHDYNVNLAFYYQKISVLYFVMSQYKEAYDWSLKALSESQSNLPISIIIDIARQASKACVVRRKFTYAEWLIRLALNLTKEHYGVHHHKYSDVLLDYGFYLINIDSIGQSVQAYQMALDIRNSIFGSSNILVGIAHEDLAYATYVHEYSTGSFKAAREHAEAAILIFKKHLPTDHLMMASSKRVKALILEEIAIDSHNKDSEVKLLQEAQELHLIAMDLTRKAFGELNVQTAKHYGNLGRLYQSMGKYKDAEKMHTQAIEIKEKLLGLEDYEVALSVGHLASLYNYDLNNYEKAEQLYLRSINIGKKLFGEKYSGLEYDYRGLIRLYNMISNFGKVNEYRLILYHWYELRDNYEQQQKREFLADTPDPDSNTKSYKDIFNDIINKVSTKK